MTDIHAADWANPDNARNLAISELAEVCAAMGLSWTAEGMKFVIELPDFIVTKVTPQVPTTKRFHVSDWGNVDVFGNRVDSDGILPDELPPTTTPLEEGEPPVGDDEK